MKRSAFFLFALLAVSLAAAPEYPKMGPDIYDVKADGGVGTRSRFVRSEETASRQIDVILESDVDVFACGDGAQWWFAEVDRRSC